MLITSQNAPVPYLASASAQMPRAAFGRGKDEPPGAELTLGHASDGTSDPRTRWPRGISIPISVPTAGRSGRIAGQSSAGHAEMMTEDAKFALGF
jgi:hypothetical protein